MQVAQGQLAAEPIADADFVARIAAGDRSAEAEFVSKYQRGVRALVRRHCRPGEILVEDLTQDVLFSVIERLRAGAIHDARSLPAYVQATVIYSTSAEYRRRRPADGSAELDDLPALDDPVQRTSASQLKTAIRRLLAELPVARDRELLSRFYLDEEDKETVCSALAIDAAHFHRVIFRARERFRELVARAGLGEI